MRRFPAPAWRSGRGGNCRPQSGFGRGRRTRGAWSWSRNRATCDESSSQGARLRAPQRCLRLHPRRDRALVESTVGGVKAALNRGRSKLAASPSPVKLPRTANPELTQVLQLYVERFNRRDWNGLRELIAADARLRVADAFAGKLVDSPYFGNYERFPMPLRLAVGEVAGEPVGIILQPGAATWTPYSTLRLPLTEKQLQR